MVYKTIFEVICIHSLQIIIEKNICNYCKVCDKKNKPDCLTKLYGYMDALSNLLSHMIKWFFFKQVFELSFYSHKIGTMIFIYTKLQEGQKNRNFWFHCKLSWIIMKYFFGTNMAK